MPALSRDRILATAVAMADRDGFDALTLRKLAAELGVHVTSLYHHVPDKDAVTDGVMEVLLAEADLPLEPLPWEAWVRRFFAAMLDLAARHPGACTAFQRRPVQGVSATASFEVALAAFAKAGLDPEACYGAIKTVTFVTMGAAAERAMLAEGSEVQTELEALPEEQFPQVRSLAGVTDPESSWAFSLEALVAGLRSQVRKGRS